MHDHGWWAMGWMWIVWIILIVGFAFLVRWIAISSRGPGEPQPSAEEILKRRYASGEIGKQEYEEKLNDLRR